MATKSQLISDIILRITKGKPSDDLELEGRQVAFWIDLVLGALVKETLDAQLKDKSGTIDPTFIKIEHDVYPKLKDTSTIYIDLCDEPINLWRDGGVIRVATMDGDWVDKMKMEEIDDMFKLKHSKPSLKNIKYTRVKERLYLYGLTPDTIQLATFYIAYVPKIKLLDEMDDSDTIDVPEDMLVKVAEEVEKIARRQAQSPEDLANNSQQNLDNN